MNNTYTDYQEARTAAKLSGKNVVVKFNDNEEVYLSTDFSTDRKQDMFFSQVDEWLANNEDVLYFPHHELSAAPGSIKYVKLL